MPKPKRISAPKGMLRPKPKNIRRLLCGVRVSKVKIFEGTGCWLRPGYRDDKGYAQIKIEGVACWAHRVSYAAFFGSVPDGMTVNHKCRTQPCINPAHLELMTVVDNSIHQHTADDEEPPI